MGRIYFHIMHVSSLFLQSKKWDLVEIFFTGTGEKKLGAEKFECLANQKQILITQYMLGVHPHCALTGVIF